MGSRVREVYAARAAANGAYNSLGVVGSIQSSLGFDWATTYETVGNWLGNTLGYTVDSVEWDLPNLFEVPAAGELSRAEIFAEIYSMIHPPSPEVVSE